METNTNEPKNVGYLKKYALFYGAGGFATLQALKTDIFSLPGDFRLYLSYLFSIITIFCCFFAGPSVLGLFKNLTTIVKQLNEINRKQDEAGDGLPKP